MGVCDIILRVVGDHEEKGQRAAGREFVWPAELETASFFREIHNLCFRPPRCTCSQSGGINLFQING